MKKILFSLILAAVAAVSCGSKDIIEVRYLASATTDVVLYSVDKEGNISEAQTMVRGRKVNANYGKGVKVEIEVKGRRSMRVMFIGKALSEVAESQELVDLGFGYVKRREFNSSYGVITGDELRRENPTQDLETALLGRVAGLTKTNGELSLRGHNSLSYSSAPLLIVDGAEVSTLANMSVYDVETVTVHKDGAMYGQRGANGVIVVRLK